MKQPYVPLTPTDAIVFLNGHDSQPANPLYFITRKQAEEVRGSLIANRKAPLTAKIVDGKVGTVIYGKDGRQMWELDWTEVDKVDGIDVQTPWAVWLGLLYWEWQAFKSNTDVGVQAGRWVKTAGGSIVRW
jgi:hypothetical protein